MLAYGLLGPHAQSLTYQAAGRTVTEATQRLEGGYLAVRPATAHGTTGLVSGSAGLFPGALAVTYDNGRSCRPQQAAGSCARYGYGAPRPARVHLGQVKVQVTSQRHRLDGSSYADLLVRFRAPVAISDIDHSYTLATTPRPACGTIQYASLGHDVRRGGRVMLVMSELPGNCPGMATARVELTQTNPYLAGPDSVIASLATFRFRLP
jgi:hypothetical protein